MLILRFSFARRSLLISPLLVHQLQFTGVFQHFVIGNSREKVQKFVVRDGVWHDELPGELVDAPQHDDDPTGDEEQEDGEEHATFAAKRSYE